ncbi:cytochrome C554 [Meridianimarinicoccus roseus]|jgi:cytochrome c556|uniref:Cytochrome C554 n=1 Tax=Meridianimarinicoccus roseus TaxID=2072018 RepID=A0A2V2LLX5_9RHOB|nr:cytochrome c [Meridianimarinicoccus roseus]PWR04067.1 cytochrome C554 [Meridianimarinicoccus roseus]
MKISHAICLSAALATAPGLAFAQDFEAALKARQGQFRIMALNLGVLGGMAKGEVAYDAALAELAAENLETISELHQAPLWPEGSDNMAIDGTRALPSIWDDRADFLAKWDAFGKAAEQLEEVADEGQSALGPAVGAVGKACGACHDAHRQPSS